MKTKTRRICSIVFFFAITTLTSGCDSGDVYAENRDPKGLDIDVTATFQFSHLDAFPTNYKLIFGSFNEESPYPLSSKVILKPAENGKTEVTLTNIPEKATYLALYLVHEYSNQQIYPFYSYPIANNPTSDIEIPLQHINLTSFKRIQKQLFSQCLQCHGGSGFAAADLYLTDEKSYSELVNVSSLRNPEKKRVSPQNTQNSYLMDILRGDALQKQHSSLSSLKEDDLTLIETWIVAGAQNE